MTNPGAADSWTIVSVTTDCRSCGQQISAQTKGRTSIVRCAECGTTNRCEQSEDSDSPSPLLVDASRADVQRFPTYREDTDD